MLPTQRPKAMATIRERTGRDGKPSYTVIVRLKGYPQQTETFARKTDAKRWALQTEAAIREGRHFKTVEAKRHTLTELVERYIRDVAPGLKTSQMREAHLLWWKAEIGDHVLADVTPALLIEKRDKLAREHCRIGRPPRARVNAQPRSVSPRLRTSSTVNRYMDAASHMFTIAMREWQWIDENPFRKISSLKEPPGRVRFLDDDERARLCTECKAHSDVLYTIVVLALSTGARRGEMLGLSWKDVDFARRTLVLHETKNGERRALPLQGRAFALVQDLAKVRRIDTDLLFPGTKDPHKPLAVGNIFNAAVTRAGIENFHFHDLRHSAASYLAMNGATIPEIAGGARSQDPADGEALRASIRSAHRPRGGAHERGDLRRVNYSAAG